MSRFQLTFFGGTGEVTGSCFLLETGKSRVLLECGLFQGGKEADEKNAGPFPFDPSDIDAVVLSHAHIDHSGRLPKLLAEGFRGPIYTHKATRDLLRIMLRDAAFLAEKDAELESRRRARKGLGPVLPLFTVSDVAKVIRRIRTLDYNAVAKIGPKLSVRLNDAGHILGSAIVEIWADAEGVSRKLVLSGDLGHSGAPMLKDPASMKDADVVLLESTYGDRDHRSWEDTYREIGEIVSGANAFRGNILIPTFAVGRAQELLYLFARRHETWNLSQWEVFLDSPMAIEATEVYAKHANLFDREAGEAARSENGLFHPPNLHLSHTANQSMRINTISSGAIILAGSGMCTGGRIRHHLKHNIWRPENHVMIVGFQARGTLGRRLVDGADRIRLWGEEIKVAAKIHTLGGLSAHAGARELTSWYKGFGGAPHLILIHGEAGASEALAQRISDERGNEISIPSPGDVFDLQSLSWAKRELKSSQA